MQFLKGYNKIYIDDINKGRPEQEKGLFAAKSIRAGENIFCARGELIHMTIKTKEDSDSYANALGVARNKWINPAAGNPLRYLNHSCEPNAGIKGRVTVVAMKQIKEGEHITIDYSTTECDPLWQLDQICQCGAQNCRKKICSIQTLPYSIYRKYLPYINKNFQAVYRKEHGS